MVKAKGPHKWKFLGSDSYRTQLVERTHTDMARSQLYDYEVAIQTNMNMVPA